MSLAIHKSAEKSSTPPHLRRFAWFQIDLALSILRRWNVPSFVHSLRLPSITSPLGRVWTTFGEASDGTACPDASASGERTIDAQKTPVQAELVLFAIFATRGARP